jgi:FkbM family methyltransferase
MMIPIEEIKAVLQKNNVHIVGAFHVGAHECEESNSYIELGVKPSDCVWVDAIRSKVDEAKTKGGPNVYQAVITDKDDAVVMFNMANNIQSSSVLEFGTHSKEHPWVRYVGKIKMKTITVDTFFKKNKMDASKYNFWNFDIQGAELMALKGATQSIQYAKAIYLEVNEKELYKGCALITDIDTFLLQYKFKRVLTTMTRHGWGDALYIVQS